MKINGIFIATVVVVFTISTRITDACHPKSEPTTVPSTESSSHCVVHEQCKDYEQCLTGKCQDICAYNLIAHAKNAICTTRNHIPYYKCPEGYNGNPFKICSKDCTTHTDCADTDECLGKKCIHGCKLIQCPPTFYCRSKNHQPSCYPITR